MSASEEDNNITTIKKRFEKQGRIIATKQAEGPQDFNREHSEKFLNTTVNDFFRDIDEALDLAGITKKDLEEETYRPDYPDENTEKEKQALVNKALQYLIVTKGYNRCDLAT